ncbi:hypothetical protein VTN00DRAFT_1961 [Thermoascus crustaceus]|uniref:uncharacterized protein n=1 Tax=Thermoascus crustaceus TaxID=5088 RepID=UPI003742BC92
MMLPTPDRAAAAAAVRGRGISGAAKEKQPRRVRHRSQESKSRVKTCDVRWAGGPAGAGEQPVNPGAGAPSTNPPWALARRRKRRLFLRLGVAGVAGAAMGLTHPSPQDPRPESDSRQARSRSSRQRHQPPPPPSNPFPVPAAADRTASRPHAPGAGRLWQARLHRALRTLSSGLARSSSVSVLCCSTVSLLACARIRHRCLFRHLLSSPERPSFSTAASLPQLQPPATSVNIISLGRMPSGFQPVDPSPMLIRRSFFDDPDPSLDGSAIDDASIVSAPPYIAPILASTVSHAIAVSAAHLFRSEHFLVDPSVKPPCGYTRILAATRGQLLYETLVHFIRMPYLPFRLRDHGTDHSSSFDTIYPRISRVPDVGILQDLSTEEARFTTRRHVIITTRGMLGELMTIAHATMRNPDHSFPGICHTRYSRNRAASLVLELSEADPPLYEATRSRIAPRDWDHLAACNMRLRGFITSGLQRYRRWHGMACQPLPPGQRPPILRQGQTPHGAPHHTAAYHALRIDIA